MRLEQWYNLGALHAKAGVGEQMLLTSAGKVLWAEALQGLPVSLGDDDPVQAYASYQAGFDDNVEYYVMFHLPNGKEIQHGPFYWNKAHGEMTGIMNALDQPFDLRRSDEVPR